MVIIRHYILDFGVFLHHDISTSQVVLISISRISYLRQDSYSDFDSI